MSIIKVPINDEVERQEWFQAANPQEPPDTVFGLRRGMTAHFDGIPYKIGQMETTGIYDDLELGLVAPDLSHVLMGVRAYEVTVPTQTTQNMRFAEGALNMSEPHDVLMDAVKETLMGDHPEGQYARRALGIGPEPLVLDEEDGGSLEEGLSAGEREVLRVVHRFWGKYQQVGGKQERMLQRRHIKLIRGLVDRGFLDTEGPGTYSVTAKGKKALKASR